MSQRSSGVTLTLCHSALQFSDQPALQRIDLQDTFDRDADVYGWTEAGNADLRRMIERDGDRRGYQTLFGPGGGGITLRSDFKIRNRGYIHVIDAVKRPASQGGHGPRGVHWVNFDFHGNDTWVGEAHWLTGYARSEVRRADHNRMTRTMVDFITNSGRGRDVAFFMGDLNLRVVEDGNIRIQHVDWLFEEPGLITAWQEAGKTLPTHGRHTIDIIGSYERDARVSLLDVDTYRPEHKDHWDLVAKYRITDRHPDGRA